MEQDYTNREINHMFEEIKQALERIETQVIKTNGRVTALEFWKAGLMARLAGITSAVAVGWVLFKEFILKKMKNEYPIQQPFGANFNNAYLSEGLKGHTGANITLSIGSTASALPNSFGVLNDPATGAPFNVQVDECSIWNREITASEIGTGALTLYNSGSGLQYPYTANSTTQFMGIFNFFAF